MDFWVPVITIIVVNIVALAFTLGKLKQTLTNLKERVGLADEANVRRNNKTERWEERMEKKANTHAMLPECIEEFRGINKQLSVLTGKVDTLIGLNKK